MYGSIATQMLIGCGVQTYAEPEREKASGFSFWPDIILYSFWFGFVIINGASRVGDTSIAYLIADTIGNKTKPGQQGNRTRHLIN
ncbi:MAG: hypothetical protein P8Z40_02420 [Chloroflexota bacterium]